MILVKKNQTNNQLKYRAYKYHQLGHSNKRNKKINLAKSDCDEIFFI